MSSYENDSSKKNLSYDSIEKCYHPRKLTIEQLKSYDGMGNISEKDAINIIDELYRLSVITYCIINK